MQQERSIRDRKVAKTANLFVRATVFSVVGRFPDAMKSGGDVYWTRRATTLGHRLVYARQAEVAHPTRRLRDLLRKQYRVGKGRYDRYILEHAAGGSRGTPRPATTRLIIESVRPPGWSFLLEAMHRHGIQVGLAWLLCVWAVGWLCRLTTALGSAHRWSEHRVRNSGRRATGEAATPADLA
jgi:glycosyltransferase AglE